MQLTRRGFLRTAILAPVVAAAIPLAPLVQRSATFATFGNGCAPPLTYAMLKQSYELCVIGAEQPNHVVISPAMLSRLDRLGLR